jgi:hypothetical protein
MPYEYLFTVAFKTQPPSRWGKGGTSVPPPAKEYARVPSQGLTLFLHSKRELEAPYPILDVPGKPLVLLRNPHVNKVPTHYHPIQATPGDGVKNFLLQRSS